MEYVFVLKKKMLCENNLKEKIGSECELFAANPVITMLLFLYCVYSYVVTFYSYVMKFDRSNKFDLCYIGQVNSLRLKSSMCSLEMGK